MKKQEFINQLRKHLASLPKSEVDDIIRDQEEFIGDAMANGRSEEQVVAGIGDPKSLAGALVAQSRIETAQGTTKLWAKARSTWKAFLAYFAVAPFNILMLVPFLIIVFILLSFWTAYFSLGFALFSAIVFIVSHAHQVHDPNVHIATALFIGGVLGVFRMSRIILFWVTKTFLVKTLEYLKWNLKLINKLGEENV